MKYLKTFEKITHPLLYKNGDYVVLDIDKFNKNNLNFQSVPDSTTFGKFPQKKYEDNEPGSKFGILTEQEFDDSFPFPYVVKTFSPGEDEEGINISPDEIERLMTPEEIDNFKLKMNANKFNI